MIVSEDEIIRVCPRGHKFVPFQWSSFLDFCPDCGSRLIVETRKIKKIRCPYCGTDKWVYGWKFCGFCGYELTDQELKDFRGRDIRQK